MNGQWKKSMLKVGLTGSFGSGKTLVAAMFKARGARVIDADALVHLMFRKDTGCRRAIARAFGADIVGAKGVDRVKLGERVFNDPKALKTLETIVHPRLGRMIVEDIKSAGRRMVVLDAAILIEAGWHKLMDVVIVVKARRDVQLKRVMARTGLSKADVLKRIRRQMPLGKKMKYAAYVIDNSGSAAITEKHVERIFRSLTLKPIRQEFSS
jgi:dephospho-CoA kinase